MGPAPAGVWRSLTRRRAALAGGATATSRGHAVNRRLYAAVAVSHVLLVLIARGQPL